MFYQINSNNPLNVTDELWNDWRWQMSQATRCAQAVFLQSVGIPALELGSERKRSVTPYMVRLLLQLQRDNSQAFKGQYAQVIATPQNTGIHQWAWARRHGFRKSTLMFPGWIKTLLWGKGCQTELQALENFYPHTDLVLATARCAVNCSFCFREVGDSTGEAASLSGSMKAILSAVEEVIKRGTPHILITGGDPLTRDNDQLRQILEPLVKAASVEVIRIATRTIVHLPMRFFDLDLLALLKEMSSRMRTRGGSLRIVTHINHPAELTDEALIAIRNIQDCGVELLNQSVVLKGVNDTETTLKDLFMRLDRLGVRPYKLFHTMPVVGTAGFRVPLWRFRQLVGSLHQWLPGTSVPQSNAPTLIGKIPVAPQGRFMIRIPFTRRILVRNWRGEWYFYEDASDPKRRGLEFSVATFVFALIVVFIMLPRGGYQHMEQLPFDQVEYPQSVLTEHNGYLDAPMRSDFKPVVLNRVLYLPNQR